MSVIYDQDVLSSCFASMVRKTDKCTLSIIPPDVAGIKKRVPHIYKLANQATRTGKRATIVDSRVTIPSFHVSCNDSYDKLFAGPRVWRSPTGLAPIWRVKQESATMHFVVTWNLPAHYVEVFGTFTVPPWSTGLPLYWCPKSKCHWVDLHEANEKLSGVVQFKFVVDGVWKCDPNYPLCDDGSPNHSLNNVSVIFHQRIRLRLSNQKIRRQKSKTSLWICGPSSRSRTSTLQSKPAWAGIADISEKPHPRGSRGAPRGIYRSAPRECPVISGLGSTTSQQCRSWLISQSKRPSTIEKPSFDSLVRCLSHHGARRVKEWRIDRKERKVAHWPAHVTRSLADPDVLLELRLPKVLRVQTSALTLKAGWAMTTHPEKRDSGGADSFYTSRDGRVMALADGVGAWELLGVNSRAYADELVNAIRDVWEDLSHPIHLLKLKPSVVARELMALAAKTPISYGSATCCIIVFDRYRQELGICNLGDSGVSVLRRNSKGHMTAYFKTPELTHFFNCPYQLSKTPPRKVIEKILGSKQVENGKGFVLPAQDCAKHAHTFDVRIEEGDLVVLASDGLWDNLWPWEIASLCTLTLNPLEALILHDESLITDSSHVARALTEAASWKSQDPRSSTPFAKNYTAECGMPGFTGGKWDDITVVTAWVARYGSRENIEISGEETATLHQIPTFKDEWRWPYVPHSDGDVSDQEEPPSI